MPAHNSAIILSLLFSVSVASEKAWAGDLAAGAPTNSPKARVEVRSEAGPGIIPAQRAYLTVENGKFAFLIPDGMRAVPSDARSIKLVKDDRGWIITVRVADAKTLGEKEWNAGACRELLSQTYPGLKVLEEFRLAAANRSGPAFDLDWKPPDGLGRKVREAFIPSAAGILEFTLDSSPEQSVQGRSSLNVVMVTFQASDADGKLVVQPLSDKL